MDPVSGRADIEREEREAVLHQLEEEARRVAALPLRDRSILATFRAPLEIAFAAVFGVICGLISLLAVIVLGAFLR